MYFKIFKPISWGKRPAERRSRLIQRFLNIMIAKNTKYVNMQKARTRRPAWAPRCFSVFYCVRAFGSVSRAKYGSSSCPAVSTVTGTVYSSPSA